jgi:hypothetical protein
MDRFLAFFTPQVIEILQKLFEPLQTASSQELTQERIDLFFEYLLNKRRRYDGNTLA